MKQVRSISGNLVDLHAREIYSAVIKIDGKHISSITRISNEVEGFILPGFIDAHIHIESSMLVPYEFARIALRHGTVATISDPHEIANVLGLEGVDYMIENGKEARLKFHFGAPSCVPATSFESAGAVIDSEDIQKLMDRDDIHYLSEMMNYPGVLNKDPEVMKKIEIAKASGKPIDGHAPGLRGDLARTYIEAGISTDHECFTLEEAEDKLACGMKILIREGSAAKNFNALHPLISRHPEMLMFCSDDKHPDELMDGHIDQVVKRSIALGYDLFDVLRMACINPVEHYQMTVGQLREGDLADFIVVEDLSNFKVTSTFIDGHLLFDGREVNLPSRRHSCPNHFNIAAVEPADFQIEKGRSNRPLIRAIDGELITEKVLLQNELVLADPSVDILKISVINRYFRTPIASAFVKGFGLKSGAMASTVAHDSHNIIVVGTSDEYMSEAANLLIHEKGGLSAVNHTDRKIIGLPVAGLMSNRPCIEIAADYSEIDQLVKEMGSKLSAPFMTLSFMALLVIPKIKLSDKGLFDAENFTFYS